MFNLINLKIVLFLFASLSLAQYSNAQLSNTIWYFGEQAGIDFSTGIPVALTNGALQAYDNTSTISDTSGNLLFYTNGVKVWDRNHLQMPNGNNLGSTLSSGQSAKIVPQPFSTKYYIFTVGYASGDAFRYSIVDMALNSGNGDVITKANILISGGSTEKIDAVYNPSDTSYWVMTHQWNSNKFYCYKINSQGLQPNPIISNIGSIHSGGSPIGENAAGQLSFSKDATKLACSIYDDGKIEIFDFNILTGQLSNHIMLSGFLRPWGIAFSLDNKYLYYTSSFTDKLFQLSLISGNPSTIIASKTLIGTATFPISTSNGFKIGYMEYGPDSILYIAKFGQHYISAITQPNQAGLSCGFVDNAVYLSTKTCDAGLSRTVFSYGWLSHCTNNYYDTLSICANDSIKIGSVFYTPPNTIVESLTDVNGCDSIQTTSLLSLPLPIVSLGNDTSFCEGDSVLLTLPNTYYSVLWNTGSNANSIYANKQGTYWVKVSDSLCENSDSIQVDNLSHDYININDTTFCEGDKWNIKLPASNTYKWYNGSSSPQMIIEDSGFYWVQITDICKTYTDSFAAQTEDCDCKMFVPNVFTPNNDGLNDFFFPVITCEFDEYHIVIYNRWGQLLFESFDQNEKWDGKYKNQEVAEGVYFYLITYKHLLSSDKERYHSGSVTLFR